MGGHWSQADKDWKGYRKDTIGRRSASILDRDPEIVVQMHSARRVFVMLAKTGVTHVYPKWVALGKIVEHWKAAYKARKG